MEFTSFTPSSDTSILLRGRKIKGSGSKYSDKEKSESYELDFASPENAAEWITTFNNIMKNISVKVPVAMQMPDGSVCFPRCSPKHLLTAILFESNNSAGSISETPAGDTSLPFFLPSSVGPRSLLLPRLVTSKQKEDVRRHDGRARLGVVLVAD